MKTRQILRSTCVLVLLAMFFAVASSAHSGTSVTGVVKSSSGRPLVSVWVMVNQRGVEKGRSLTGDDGKYYISNLNGGAYEIVVQQGNQQVYKAPVILQGGSRHDISIMNR